MIFNLCANPHQDYKAGKVDLGDINSSVIVSDIAIKNYAEDYGRKPVGESVSAEG